jgi:hypothetical protein
MTLSYSIDAGTTWNIFITTQTSGGGAYSVTWYPPYPGTYQLKASWAGDQNYVDASSAAASLSVTGSRPPQVALLVSGPASASRGSTVTYDLLVTNPGTSLTTTLYIEVTGPGGYEYFDTLQVSIAGSASSSFYFVWQVPMSASSGNYQIIVGQIPPTSATITQTQISVT